MDDLYYDQGWRRRQNRFESLDNVGDYCNVGGAVRRGNSASCISRQYRPDYFVNPQSQFDNGPSFRESYAPHSIYESGRLQRAYDNQNLGGDNYTYYSHHNTPSRVNTMRNIPRGRRNSAVHTFYDAPVRSNIYDQNNFIRENDRPALFVTPIKAIAFDRDV